jgi:hypothetical protein
VSLPRSWPPTREDELEMLATPAEWPQRPRLPVKRSKVREVLERRYRFDPGPAATRAVEQELGAEASGFPEFGFLLEGEGFRVYVGFLDDRPAQLRKIDYPDAAAVLDAGWRVD